MGLAWQQGPLAPGAIGQFLIPEPPPERLLFAEPLRRRMRVKCLDGTRLRLEPGQTVIPHGADRDLSTGEITPRTS